MNTKQVEELTGISRQNMRYYERMGLLEPNRETGNAYRDYSEEDIRRLKLIKMLRMLDMPLKEIEAVLKEEQSLKEAAARQQEQLQKQQRQLQAAIEVCTSIYKEKTESVDVDSYLERMENMSQNGSVFARIVDDYKQVALEEQERRFSFYPGQDVNTAGMFDRVLREYAAEHGMKFLSVKGGMYPEFMLDGIRYTAARVLEENAGEMSVRIVCKKEDRETVRKEGAKKRRNIFRGIHSITVNIQRNRKKSILNALLSLLIVMVMAFYLGNLNSIRQQLEDMPEKFPVSAEIWNVCGDANSGLFISETVLDAVYQSSYTEQIAEGCELIGVLSAKESGETEEVSGGKDVLPEEESGEAQQEMEEYRLWGLNRMEVVDGLEEEYILWLEEWNWEKFQKSRKVCIVAESFAEKNNVEPGDVISFSLERYRQTMNGSLLEREQLLPASMTVIGTIPSRSDIEAPDVLLPLECVKQIFEENDKTYVASSLSFMVKDPMKLNELKQELKDVRLQPIASGSLVSYAGVGLKIDDAMFIQIVTNLEESLSLMEGFMPFVLLIVVMAGYLIPHLLLQSRQKEYAIMRALGTGKKQCGLLFFTEHILLAAAGSIVGTLAAVLLRAVDTGTAAMVWLVFLICYALGAAVAIAMFGRFSVAAVLAHRD